MTKCDYCAKNITAGVFIQKDVRKLRDTTFHFCNVDCAMRWRLDIYVTTK